MDVGSAQEAAKQGKLNNWVYAYLDTEGETELNKYLQAKGFALLGPKLIALEDLERTIGPEQRLLHTETQAEMDLKIQRRLKQLSEGKQPPILAEELNCHFVICDGSHLYEALKQLGNKECWVVYWQDSHIHKAVVHKKST